jgi:hypothetical protein
MMRQCPRCKGWLFEWQLGLDDFLLDDFLLGKYISYVALACKPCGGRGR